MLVALLIGLGVGLLAIFFLQVKLQRDLRVLLSDIHLSEIMNIINHLKDGDGERISLAGVGLSLGRDADNNEVLWLRSARSVPAAGIPWIIAVASVLMETSPDAVKTDGTHWRMKWVQPRPAPEMDDVLTALRQDAADRLGLVRIEG